MPKERKGVTSQLSGQAEEFMFAMKNAWDGKNSICDLSKYHSQIAPLFSVLLLYLFSESICRLSAVVPPLLSCFFLQYIRKAEILLLQDVNYSWCAEIQTGRIFSLKSGLPPTRTGLQTADKSREGVWRDRIIGAEADWSGRLSVRTLEPRGLMWSGRQLWNILLHP